MSERTPHSVTLSTVFSSALVSRTQHGSTHPRGTLKPHRNATSDLDQALDQPFYRPSDLFAHEVELPDHVQKTVGQNPHEQPGLVGAKRRQLVLSPRSVFFPSLIRFSTSPRPLYTLTTFTAGSLELVTMYPILGKSSPWCHSISVITLRSRSHVCARYRTSTSLT